MQRPIIRLGALCLLATLTTAQLPRAAIHRTDFNSSLTLTTSQIASAELNTTLVTSLQNILNFDHSQLAFGGPVHDAFYALPNLTTSTPPKPGTLLKLQNATDPTAYTIPPGTALSRFLYTTTNYNGTVIPTSAFILWPFLPRPHPKGKVPVVLWTHGTSGFFTPHAPSANRGLWYENSALFTLAEAGYAVVAPDYAGLGVSASWDGAHIPHQYLAAPAGARDALYGLHAARHAFPEVLAEEFVVFGHSQGGGVAWATAEALADDEFRDLGKGYKGTIAASPTTDVFALEATLILPTLGNALASVFPAFRIEEWLTDLGVRRLELIREVQGGIMAVQHLFFGREGVVRQGWNETWYADAFGRLMNAGKKKYKGPLLVVQGDEDFYVPIEDTARAVKETWERFPESDLEFYVAKGVGHTPVLHATRLYWLRWIEERFDGRPVVKKGGVRTDVSCFLPTAWYQKYKYAFPLWTWLPEYQYETTLAL